MSPTPMEKLRAALAGLREAERKYLTGHYDGLVYRSPAKTAVVVIEDLLAASPPGEARPNGEGLDDLEAAWIVIANVSGGDWSRQSIGWQGAAARWRDRYHAPTVPSRDV